MDKLDFLKQILAGFDRLCVCYSGGTDSAFLLKVAHDVLGDRAFGVIADAVVLPRAELEDALAQAKEIGAACHVVVVDALSVPQLRANDKKRCYYCKRNIFGQIAGHAALLGASAIADGKNADDALAFRPGAQAAAELGVVSPLYDAGMTKRDIRRYSRELGLKTWDRPAAACLATRVPYDVEVTLELLGRIEAAEALLHEAGFPGVRARVHGDLLRVEVPREEIGALAARLDLAQTLKHLGFRYVTIDFEGFRSGSMD